MTGIHTAGCAVVITRGCCHGKGGPGHQRERWWHAQLA